MEKLNLLQKIVEVKKVVSQLGLEKDKQGYNFSYVTGDQILAKITPRMNELNLLLIPNIKEAREETRVNNKGKAISYIIGDIVYTWINADNPSDTLTINWKLYGKQEDISQAYGSALTYSERYFLLKFFGVPTDILDPDLRNYNQDNNQGNAFISNNQRRYLGKVAEGNIDIIQNVLTKNGYEKSEFVKVGDYEKIVEGIKEELKDLKKSLDQEQEQEQE